MKVLVTGGNGQLGQSIQAAISRDDLQNYVFVNSKTLDITNVVQVQNIFAQHKFTHCINCAAYTAVDKAESEPDSAFAVNVAGVQNVVEACLQYDITLIHISTDFVFDGQKETPYTEEDIPNPINIYGETKLQGEKIIQELLAKYYIIRTSWLYSEYGSNFMKTMLRLGKERNQISVVNDQFGTPTYAGDLAKALLHIINSKSNQFGLYHYSNEGACSWYNFAKAIFDAYQYNVEVIGIPTEAYPTAAARPRYSVLMKGKIRRHFKIEIVGWENYMIQANLHTNT